ncbi:MAG TPA: hypothetical protein VIF15_00315 [Polyangiaceae bacterium]|jgi:hypothetical protein
MDGAVRKGGAPAEATQELQAIDVLEVVETVRARSGTRKARPSPSASSIAPVGLDLGPAVDIQDEEVNATMQIRIPGKRRSLRGVVIGALAGCALILVAAAIARVGHASSEEPLAPKQASTTAPTSTSTPAKAAATPPVPNAFAPSAPGSTDPSTGTLRLDKPAVAGRVWLDGKKLSSPSALVTCGTHKIKVGRGRTHSVDVPCGGEIGVSR